MKKTNIAILTLALLLSAGGSVLAASKFNPKQAPPGGGRQDNNRIAINQTFDNGDYTAWKNLMGDNPITEKITADNFARFAEAHKLMEAGKTDEAKAIMDELGLTGIGMGRGGFNHGGCNQENHQAIMDAITNGDYTAWKNLMGDNPITEKITADNFAKFAEAHKLMLAGQTDEAQKIMTELGLDHGFGMGMMKNGRGLKNGFRHGQEQSDQ